MSLRVYICIALSIIIMVMFVFVPDFNWVGPHARKISMFSDLLAEGQYWELIWHALGIGIFSFIALLFLAFGKYSSKSIKDDIITKKEIEENKNKKS